MRTIPLLYILTLCILYKQSCSFVLTRSVATPGKNSPKKSQLSTKTNTLASSEDHLPHATDEVSPENKVTQTNKNINKNRSKTQWKKKKYLMMNDIMEAIKKKDPKAILKAQHTVQRMQAIFQRTRNPLHAPTLQVYNLWIHALAKTCTDKPGEKAEQVLRKAQETLLPNLVTYTSVLDAYSEQAKRDPEATTHAERLLWELLEESERRPIKVNALACDVVLKAYAAAGQAQRAQDTLFRIENANLPNIKPTPHSYATVLHAWAESNGGVAAAQAAQDLLSRVPCKDTVMYNAVIHAWAVSRDPQAGSKAMALLHEMKEPSRGCVPDIVTYNSILSAWANSGHINSGIQAQRILQELMESDDTLLQPNLLTFNAVIHAWGRSGHPSSAHKAEQILKYMIASKMEPDTYSYSHVLDALAKSKETDKAARCREWLDCMVEQAAREGSDFKLTTIPFNTILNAAAFSAQGTSEEEQRNALQIAVRTFAELKQREDGLRPDDVSYGNMIKCLTNLIPRGKKRSEMAMQVFEQCCKEGLVGELAWNEVRRAVPASRLNNFYKFRSPVGSIQVRDLPRDWIRTTFPLRKKVRGARKSRQAEEGIEGKSKAPVRRQRSFSEASYSSGKDI